VCPIDWWPTSGLLKEMWTMKRLCHNKVRERSLIVGVDNHPQTPPALREKDLADWYLNEIADELDTEEQLDNESVIVNRIIARLVDALWESFFATPNTLAHFPLAFRLITRDAVLVRQSDGTIMVNPNYALPFE